MDRGRLEASSPMHPTAGRFSDRSAVFILEGSQMAVPGTSLGWRAFVIAGIAVVLAAMVVDRLP